MGWHDMENIPLSMWVVPWQLQRQQIKFCAYFLLTIIQNILYILFHKLLWHHRENLLDFISVVLRKQYRKYSKCWTRSDLTALYFLHRINASIGALSFPCSFLSHSPSTPSQALLIQPAPLQFDSITQTFINSLFFSFAHCYLSWWQLFSTLVNSPFSHSQLSPFDHGQQPMGQP